MNKSVLYRMASVILIPVMALAMIPPFSTSVASAESGDPAMVIGSSVLDQSVNRADGHQLVSYGMVTQTTIPVTPVAINWYIIGYDKKPVNTPFAREGALTLLNKLGGFRNVQYRVPDPIQHYIPNPNSPEFDFTYGNSDLRKMLLERCDFSFSKKERSKLLTRSISGTTETRPYYINETIPSTLIDAAKLKKMINDFYNSDLISGNTLNEEHIWPLSVAEASALPSDFLKFNNNNWWLRSPGYLSYTTDLQPKLTFGAAYVDKAGVINPSGANVSSSASIRPAIQLSLDDIILTSAQIGGKKDEVLPSPGALEPVEKNVDNQWKLTLKDEDHDDFKFTCDYDKVTKTATINYSDAVCGSNEYISALITDEDGNVKSYGRVAGCQSPSGTANIELKNKLYCGDRLYVFNEQHNNDRLPSDPETGNPAQPPETDYSSSLREVPIESPDHDSEHIKRVEATCLEDGIEAHWRCDDCESLFRDSDHTIQITKPSVIPKTEHNWDDGTIIQHPSTTASGIRSYSCTTCNTTKTETIPQLDPSDDPSKDPNKMGEDGTPTGKGASAAAAELAITSATNDKDPRGSKFSILRLKSTKQGKRSAKLTWSKAKGATKYVLYGNVCGKGKKMMKLSTIGNKGSFNVTKLKSKLSKGKYHKFIIVALDNDNMVVSTSKIVHVATKGGKVTNPKKVTVKKGRKSISKATVKTGKSLKIKSTVTKAVKKLKFKKHRAVSYESSNTKIATVTGKGKIIGKGKGTCYVYAYAQNGAFKRVKITVN